MTRSNLGPDPSATRRDEAGVVAPSRVMLVAIVLVAIAAVTYVAGLGSKDETDVASAASSRQTPSATASEPSTSASTSPSAAPSASSSPSAGQKSGKAQQKGQDSARQKSSKAAGGSASGGPGSGSGSAASQVQRSQVDVSVFNNSSRTGLAARTSGKVKAAGWKVIGTDNWYGTIPQPTVYYPARLQQAAELLAEDVGIDRVRPAVSPMRSDRLTLIVTADYSA